MSRLEKNLKNWVSTNLISSQQADAILHYESSHPGASWVQTGLLILGVIVIGTGIISVIAANWMKIPDAVKLTLNFCFLGALAYGILYCWNHQKKIAFEVLIIFFMIFCLASIGLISQIYHTGGELYQALLLWSLITCGIATAARITLTPTFWLITFLSAAGNAMMDSAALKDLFRHNEVAIFMMIPLFCACLTALCTFISRDNPSAQAARICALMAGLIGLVAAETIGSNGYISTRIEVASPPFWPAYLFLVITLLTIAKNKSYQSIQRVLLFCSIGFFAFIFMLPVLELTSNVIYAIVALLSLGSMTIFLATIQHRRLFQFFLFLVGLRFIVLYFQAFGGLATTGFGLMVSGMFIIGMTVLWNKYRTSIATWAEKWGQ
jgi:uncharacterized membrane protein